jgi:hypothetical protein
VVPSGEWALVFALLLDDWMEEATCLPVCFPPDPALGAMGLAGGEETAGAMMLILELDEKNPLVADLVFFNWSTS